MSSTSNYKYKKMFNSKEALNAKVLTIISIYDTFIKKSRAAKLNILGAKWFTTL